MHRNLPFVVVFAALAAACADTSSRAQTGAPDGDAIDGGTDAVATDTDASADGDAPEPLQGLPAAPATAMHGPFMSWTECAFCHSAGTGVMQDPVGRSVAPPDLWAGSMMAHSARDPYWLAAFAHEHEANPEATELIDAVCTRCHAPAGNVAGVLDGDPLTIDEIVSGTTDRAHLAREGVTCTVCHQITTEGLGEDESFTGGYVIGEDRLIFGPHADPFTNPMRQHVDYTPTESSHMLQSAHCATCHTVITHALDDAGQPTGQPFAEQVPYLEWRNSVFSTEGPSRSPVATDCQGCHTAREDADGDPFTTVLSLRPPWLDTQREVGRHTFAGANAWMLDVMATNADRLGVAADVTHIREGIIRAETMLTTAASVAVEPGDAANTFVVTVTNHSGHRFPTAYPSRRAWLEVRVEDAAGDVVWHTGAFDDAGYLIGPDGARIGGHDVALPHRDVITAEGEVQVWESVMADATGAQTHTLLDATHYLVDDRILPAGWSATGPHADMTAPVGTDDDANFVAGSDAVTIALPAELDAARITATVWYQSVPPGAIDAVHSHPTAQSAALVEMAEATPPTPRRVASSSWTR